MTDQMDIITFKLAERFFGIDGDEVERVIETNKAQEAVTEKEYSDHLFADKFFHTAKVSRYSAVLVISGKENRKFLFNIPELEDMIVVQKSMIHPVPELIKRKQNPFVVWGFVEAAGKSITLITFDYFI